MTRLRTHNKRAKRIGYALFAQKRRHARKTIRFAAMYGMGARGIEACASKFFPHQRDFVDKFFKSEEGPFPGTVTGRMVVRGPEPQYQLPKSSRFVEKSNPVFLTNFAEQEARALAWHRQSLDEARARGDTVIEHTYADATILVKEDNDAPQD